MLHVELSAEVVEGEEGVGEHQVLGAHGNGDEWGELSCPAHPRDKRGPRNPIPCCALSGGIPSWRPQGAGPVAAAAAHQCRACRGPRPAKPHPRSPAVRTRNRERRETEGLTARQAGGGRAQACKAGSARCSALPCLGRRWPCLLGLALCPPSPPVHCHLLQAKWEQSHITQAPITHTPGVWNGARANTWWSRTSQVGKGGAKQVKPVPDQAPPSGGGGPVLPEAWPAHGQWQPRP